MATTFTKDQGDPRVPVQNYIRNAAGDLVPVDASNPQPVTGAASSTGAQTSVAAAAADTTILAANTARKRATILNDSASATLYLLLASGTSSTTNFSVALPPGGVWEETVYTGVIKGIWSAAVGNARVTENT